MKKLKILPLILCGCLLFSLSACKEEEEDINYGTIIEDSTDSEQSSSELQNTGEINVTPEENKKMDKIADNISISLVYSGEVEYDGVYEFMNVPVNSILKEYTFLVKVPEDTGVRVTTDIASTNGISNNEHYKNTGIYADAIVGPNNYIFIHAVFDSRLNLSDYRIKLNNNISSNDYVLRDIPTTVSEVPDDLKASLIDIGGKLFYSAPKDYMTNKEPEGLINKKEGEVTYHIFVPVNCSSVDFPRDNLYVKFSDNLDERILDNTKVTKTELLDDYTLKTDSYYALSVPVMEVNIIYDTQMMKSDFGDDYVAELGMMADGIEFYINNDYITNLK